MAVELLLKDEVYAVVGAAMEVHSVLGSGFAEAVYQEAMEIELASRSIPFKSQVLLKISYKDTILKKEYLADLICYDQVILEIKAQSELTGKEESQLLNYLRATRLRVGVVANFGDPARLDWYRMVN